MSQATRRLSGTRAVSLTHARMYVYSLFLTLRIGLFSLASACQAQIDRACSAGLYTGENGKKQSHYWSDRAGPRPALSRAMRPFLSLCFHDPRSERRSARAGSPLKYSLSRERENFLIRMRENQHVPLSGTKARFELHRAVIGWMGRSDGERQPRQDNGKVRSMGCAAAIASKRPDLLPCYLYEKFSIGSHFHIHHTWK